VKRAIVLILPLALSLTRAAPARAQDTLPTASVPSGGGFCFRGRPKPKCGSFMITEFAMLHPLGPVLGAGPMGGLELGMMVNVGRRSAIGGTLLLGGDDSWSRVVMGVRFRRWLSPSVSAELGVGRVSASNEGPGGSTLHRSGFATRAGLDLSDLVGFTVAYEHLGSVSGCPSGWPCQPSPAASGWLVGVKAGSYAGPAVALGLALLMAGTW